MTTTHSTHWGLSPPPLQSPELLDCSLHGICIGSSACVSETSGTRSLKSPDWTTLSTALSRTSDADTETRGMRRGPCSSWALNQDVLACTPAHLHQRWARHQRPGCGRDRQGGRTLPKAQSDVGPEEQAGLTGRENTRTGHLVVKNWTRSGPRLQVPSRAGLALLAEWTLHEGHLMSEQKGVKT